MDGGAPRRPAEIDLRKLIRCLEMLGSVHDGEVLNAALAAQRLVCGAGLVWADLIGLPPDPSRPRPSDPAFQALLLSDWPAHWRWAACACLESESDLRDKDRQFLRNIVR
jgi:hypothetical protein